MNKPKLLDQLRQEIRRRNYSFRTGQAYLSFCVELLAAKTPILREEK